MGYVKPRAGYANIGFYADPVQSLVELAELPFVILVDKQIRLVEDSGAIYRFDIDALAGNFQPNDAPGVTGFWVEIGFGGGGGESNLTTNVGAGHGVALAKVGVTLPFKSFVEGDDIEIVSSADELRINYTGAFPVSTKAMVLERPIASDNISIFFTEVAITITQINDVIVGATSVAWNISHAPTRNGSPNDIFAVDRITNSIIGSETTIFDDATIPAGSWVWYEASAIDGIPDALSITIEYTID
jgi:hypothetical protein